MRYVRFHFKALPVLLLASCFLLLGSCRGESVVAGAEEYVPAAPDYSGPEMWVRYSNDTAGTGADVFYIPSTWEFDYTVADGRICHYADPSLEAHRRDMATEMNGVADYMADGNDFYSPYYRHITLDTWATLNEDTINRRYHDVAFKDVRAAFDRFCAGRDPERPLILAGFSQGGKSVVELLKVMDEGVRERLVAAYVMGYKVTPDDVARHPWIVGAADSIDTGVTVCYNSVSDVRYAKPVVCAPNVMCINPVNWITEEFPAVLDDTITVTLDPRAKVLVVEGYDGSALPNILDILNTGDYHGAEPWLYSECLRRNIKARIRSYRSNPKR